MIPTWSCESGRAEKRRCPRNADVVSWRRHDASGNRNVAAPYRFISTRLSSNGKPPNFSKETRASRNVAVSAFPVRFLLQALGGASVGSPGSALFPSRAAGPQREGRSQRHAVLQHRKTTRLHFGSPLRHLPLVAGRARDQVHVPAPLQGRVHRQRPLPGQGSFRIGRAEPVLQVDEVGKVAVSIGKRPCAQTCVCASGN